MRDNLSKPSGLAITKVLCAKQNKVSGLPTIQVFFAKRRHSKHHRRQPDHFAVRDFISKTAGHAQ